VVVSLEEDICFESEDSKMPRGSGF